MRYGIHSEASASSVIGYYICRMTFICRCELLVKITPIIFVIIAAESVQSEANERSSGSHTHTHAQATGWRESRRID